LRCGLIAAHCVCVVLLQINSFTDFITCAGKSLKIPFAGPPCCKFPTTTDHTTTLPLMLQSTW
jgi:hypothetical protein